MSFIGANFGVGSGPASGLRFAQTRGRIQNGAVHGVNYPSPFFDVAHTYLPVTVKQLFKWCRYYCLTNPLINATVFKLSEYPVTDIIIDHKSPSVVKLWTEYFQDHFRYRSFQVETGLDYHCLGGDTRVITQDGVVAIRDLVGKTVQVLSEGGVYREASFHFYGKQRLWEIHTEDGVMLATDEHRWPVWDPKEKKIVWRFTKQLGGKTIPRTVAPRPEKNQDFWTGVRHGIVFGDGTISNEGKQAHLILYSHEKRYLARYFEGHCSAITPHHEERYLGVYGLPPEFKELPSETASASYWYGFTCGLLATDGSVSKRDGATTLNQKKPEALIAISKRLPWFGMLGGRVREYWVWSNFTKQEEPVNVLNLKKQFLQFDDFIRPDQRRTFEEHFRATSYGKFIGVQKVVPTDRVEDVFCCIEPETHSFVIEHGVLTGNCYGNAAISLAFPFKKYLSCRSCDFKEQANKIRPYWVFTNYAFRMTCPRCGYIGDAIPRDVYFKNASGIKPIRWNPEDIEITYNDVTGEYTYFYTIPAVVRNDIVIGRKDIVEGIPQVFIQAMREQKGIIFSKENFFHLRRATLATQDRGWGIPLLLPVLKDTFYLQIMKKAQEAILLEHIVPLRVLFPQPSSGTSDPYCLSPETLVETIDGLRPASEVHTGDFLRSHTGAWRMVSAQKRRSVGDQEKVYKVKVASLTAFPFEASEDHPILAIKKTHPQRNGYDRQKWVDPRFIPIKDLREGDLVAYPTKRVQSSLTHIDLAAYVDRAATNKYVYRRLSQGAAEIYEWLEENADPSFSWGERASFLAERGWSEKDFACAYSMRSENSIDRMPRYIPIDLHLATLIGYYLAEGCLKDGIPTFSLHIKETSIADRIELAATTLGFRGTSRYERPQQNGLTVDVQDILLGGLLQGVCGKYAQHKSIPQFISEASNHVLLRVLDCLFEGDGCSFKTSTNRVALKTCSPNLALEARRLLLSYGLIGTITREVMDEKDIAVQDAFHLNFNGEQADHLRLLLCGGPTRFAAPFSKCGLFRDEYVLLRISEIEETASVREVIGFQMDEDKSFCVAGVATHNTSINLVDWRDHVAAEIARWRFDSNYIPILPLPIGNQTIGGDGRALLLTGEIQQWSEHIMMGMGVPREFLIGGMSYAGTNVSMRMLENAFIGYIERQKALARFMMQSVASYLEWPMASIRFKPFKMADDIQRKAYNFQLNAAGKISDKTLLADSDFSSEEENQIIISETDMRLEATKKQQLATAQIQGEAQLVMMKFQAKAQQEMQAAMVAPVAPGEAGGPEAGGAAASAPGGQGAAPGASVPQAMGMQSPLGLGQKMPVDMTGQGMQVGGLNVDITALAQAQANLIATLPPQQQQFAINNLRAQSAELAELTESFLAQKQDQQGQNGGGGAMQVDMRPLPEQRSPRRAVGIV